MTHDGRMKRGKLNFEKGLLDNEDTKYFLENRPVEKPKKEVKKSGRSPKHS